MRGISQSGHSFDLNSRFRRCGIAKPSVTLPDEKAMTVVVWPILLQVVGLWYSWRVMSSSLLFTRRLGRLSFIACLAMLVLEVNN